MPTPEEVIYDVFGVFPPTDICVEVKFPEGSFSPNPAAKSGYMRKGLQEDMYFMLIGDRQYTLVEGLEGWSDRFTVPSQIHLINLMGQSADWYIPQLPRNSEK